MSDIEARVKKIIAEQLGVKKAKSPARNRLWPTWAQTHLTQWNW